MPTNTKIMESVSAMKLRPSTTFEGSQTVDNSTNHERYARNWSRAHAKSGSRGTVRGGHSVKTQRRG